jgi:hypothetical protein
MPVSLTRRFEASHLGNVFDTDVLWSAGAIELDIFRMNILTDIMLARMTTNKRFGD